MPTGPALVGRTWVYPARATDPEGDTLRYTLGTNAPSTASIDVNTGRVTYTPESAGSVNLTVIATDTAGNRAEQQFSLPVIVPPSDTVNRPPLFTSTPFGPARLNQEWIYLALALDADGDAVTYSLDSATLAAGATIEAATGRIKWTPRAVGTQPITVTARDTAGNIATQRFELLIVRDNRAPVIESEPNGPVVSGRPWTFNIITSDPDGDTVTLSLDADSRAPRCHAGWSATELDAKHNRPQHYHIDGH